MHEEEPTLLEEKKWVIGNVSEEEGKAYAGKIDDWRRKTLAELEKDGLPLIIDEHPPIDDPISSHIRSVEDEIEQILEQTVNAGPHQKHRFGKQIMAIHEAFVNAHQHGAKCDATKIVEVHLQVFDISTSTAKKIRAVIRVADPGDGFPDTILTDPTSEEGITRPTGRGTLFMTSFMDSRERNEKGNVLTLGKTWELKEPVNAAG